MWSGDDIQTNWFGDTIVSIFGLWPIIIGVAGERPEYSTNFNIRILNWGGLSDKTGAWSLTNEQGNPTVWNEYPYAYTFNYNHSGEPGILENNLSWSSFAGSLDTDGISLISQYQRGLFDRYYGRLFEKINGGAALRTCMINLSQSDIANFDFRNIIKIVMDGGIETYWTVNQIIDYTPGKDELTKVELIEWKYGFSKGKGKTPTSTNYGGIRPNDIGGGKGDYVGVNGEATIYSNGQWLLSNETPALSETIKVSNNITPEFINQTSKLRPLEIEAENKEKNSGYNDDYTNGGSITADVSTKEFSMTSDIYYLDLDGVRQKICLKERKR